MKRWGIITIGDIVMALGIHLFLVPENLAAGGLAGIAMMIKAYLPDLNIGLIMMIFNVLLIILAYFFIDKAFAISTIYASILLSVLLGVFEKFMQFGNIFPDEKIMNLVCGIGLLGVGLALVFSQNASGGGMDIVAKFLSQILGISISQAVFFSNVLITIAAMFVFDFPTGIYAFLGILLNSLIIDKVIAGFDVKVHALVFSDKKEEIVSYIHKEIDRGATFFKAEGTYSRVPKDVISVVLDREDYIKLRRHLEEVDPHAFVIMNYIHDVIGEGFTIYSR